MKRSWIGFTLLILLLLGSILTTWAMPRIHEPVEADLLQAAARAIEGDWEKTEHFFLEAEKEWKEWEHFRACFADHNPVEEIDAAFDQLKVYCSAREEAAFAGFCRDLARKVAAVGEAHELVWWNLL